MIPAATTLTLATPIALVGLVIPGVFIWWSLSRARHAHLIFSDIRLLGGIPRGWRSRLHHLPMILRCLAERPGEVVSRAEILDRVWGADGFSTSRTVDNFIVRLRRVIEPDPQAPRHIHTVRGVGYRLTF